MAPAEKDISLTEDSRKNHSSKHSFAQSQCSREMSPLAKEQSRGFSAFLGERNKDTWQGRMSAG